MPQLEAWWVCNHCGKPLIRIGKRGFMRLITEHRKVCDPTAGGIMKQLDQAKMSKRT
jgi:hypothetical protein